jgi:aminomethyltransferase
MGRSALEKQKAAGNLPTFSGLILQGRGVLRSHQKLFAGDREVGEITSGGFSPTLERSIAMARIEPTAGSPVEVDIRGRRIPVARVKMPFARNGKTVVDLAGI